MRKVVFDIETKNTFADVGSNDPADLDISVVGVYDYETKTLRAFEEHQFKDMWPIFEKAEAIIGYNSDHFDLPLLNKYYPGDLSAIKSIDLMKSIKESLGRRLKLDSIAQATLGTSKSAEGLSAVKWWNEGRVDLIIEYCLKDVEITRDIFEYAMKHKHLKVMDGSEEVRIPISTDGWKDGNGSSLTHALPF